MQRPPLPLRLYKQMDESTQQLIKDCRSGNRRAQLTLYNLHARRLYNACLRITGRPMEAEEVMQDAFLKIFSHLDQYRTEQCFEAWMQRIAIHTAIDYVRRKSPEWEELSENQTSADEAALTDEREEEEKEAAIRYTVTQIKETMQHLADGYRMILSLYLFEGYDMEEIASILHIQPASVRSQYLRAKRKLLDILRTTNNG
ncbi:MAG: sigma-70 family RNA polymerase sigma factor [Tannerellaceae bacterium]